MAIAVKKFRVRHRQRVHLDQWATRIDPLEKAEADYEAMLKEQVAALDERQAVLAADGRYSVLLVLQGMDAGGKDGAIKHVFTGLNPQGCNVSSFKAPSAEDLAHDFLWRVVKHLPARGTIGIFNRSHYEEVLVVRVHPELLAKQGLPPECADAKTVWDERYRSIRHFERHLVANGTLVVKVFLHLSKEEQRKRFLKRLEHPDKAWKFSLDDAREREHWSAYQRAYERCLEGTSTREAPWYVVPADDKRDARLVIAAILLRALERIDLRFPQPPARRKAEFARIRQSLRG